MKNNEIMKNLQRNVYFFNTISHLYINLKFGDFDGPNLCRVKKVDVSSKFIENIFRSGLTLVSSNDNNHQNR